MLLADAGPVRHSAAGCDGPNGLLLLCVPFSILWVFAQGVCPASVRPVSLPRGSVRAWLTLLVGLTTLSEVGAVAEGHSEGRSPACLP